MHLLERVAVTAANLHVKVVFHVALTTAITDLVLVTCHADPARAVCLLRASPRRRRTLLHVVLLAAIAARRALKPMPAQVVRTRLLLRKHGRFILPQRCQSLRVHHLLLRGAAAVDLRLVMTRLLAHLLFKL